MTGRLSCVPAVRSLIRTVKAAAAELHTHPTPAAAVPAGHDDQVDVDVDEDEEGEELAEEVLVLIDRLEVLRSHVDDLRLAVSDPILARRELSNIEEEVEQVRAALTHAYGADRP